MKRFFWFMLIVGFASIAYTDESSVTNLLTKPSPPYVPQKPEPHFGEVARQLYKLLPEKHISKAPFDDSISRKAWTNLLDMVDYDRTLLTQKDLERLTPMETQIDDHMREGNVNFGFELHTLIVERVEARYNFVTNAIAQGFDFSVEESWNWQRKSEPRPQDEAAQQNLWRLQVKNEYLTYILAKEIEEEEAEKKKAEADAAGKTEEAAETDDSEKPKNAQLDVTLQTPQEVVAKRYQRVWDAYREMDPETILQRYLSAVSQAYDPHTDYMSPMTVEDFAMGMNLTLYGIGASLRSEDGLVKVMEIMPGGPAERDTRDIRLVEGDKIIGVGQGEDPIEDIQHKALNRVVRQIRGPKGTKVVLQVIPATDPTGSKTKLVDLIRDEIKLEEQAVTGRVETVTLPDGTARRLGYVRVPTFYGSMNRKPGEAGFRSMTYDLIRYIADFNLEKVEGLVVDLRSNGGGNLIEAIQMTSLFVKGPVVQVRDNIRIQVLNTPIIENAYAFRKPIVVLVNRLSASASEIVAGALQDYGRAILVGDSRTHGKGTVQTVIPFSASQYGNEKVTSGAFYRVNGGSTQLKGVSADIILPSPFDVMKIGEDTLTGALPWSKISPAYYDQVSDLSKYIPDLREKASERLAKNPDYARHCRVIRRIEDVTNDTVMPLQIDARREKIRAEHEVRRLEEKEIEESLSGKKDDPAKDDIVLQESFNILSDYIDLFGSGDVVDLSDGDLRTRMLRLFGI